MKKNIRNLMQAAVLQSFWAKLFHVAKVSMNYWGAGSYIYSGELNCFKDVFLSRDKNKLFIFFDVGANEGNYVSDIAKIMAGNSTAANGNDYFIYCFEPSLKIFHKLEEKTAGNKKIFINNTGLGETASTGILFVPAGENVLSSAFSKHIDTRAITDYSEEHIKIDTIDNYCVQNNIKNISFLKIDVEGFELNVLNGAKDMLAKNAIDIIQFEFGECMIAARVFFKDFWNLLHTHYNLYRILPQGLFLIKEYSEELEVFHCANFLAKNKSL